MQISYMIFVNLAIAFIPVISIITISPVFPWIALKDIINAMDIIAVIIIIAITTLIVVIVMIIIRALFGFRWIIERGRGFFSDCCYY